MSKLTIQTLATLAISTLMLTGCNDSPPATQSPAESITNTPTWVLASEPEEAQSVGEAKASALEGEQVVIRGRIGGRKEPLTEGSSVFTVIDLAIPHCGDNPDDGCRTPWDYCCETPDTITTNSVTIQVVDASGKPITDDLAIEGLSALDEVIVVGTVAPRPNENVLTVRATGVYRVDD